VDIDFECEREDLEPEYYDIYGSVTVPQICADVELPEDEKCDDTE